MTRYKHDPNEANDQDSGIVNVDHVVTTGSKIDKRQYSWPEDDDLTRQHRVRRQPDKWFYDADVGIKRGESEQLRLIPREEPGEWHFGPIFEGSDWTTRQLTRENQSREREATKLTGIPPNVPVAQWSMTPVRCYVCWKPTSDDSKAKYCGTTCRRAADATRKARKRRLADGVRKYPRDENGWYINQFTPWPKPGLNVSRSTDRLRDLEVRHGIMASVRRRPMTAPTWWVDTIKDILTAEQEARRQLAA